MGQIENNLKILDRYLFLKLRGPLFLAIQF